MSYRVPVERNDIDPDDPTQLFGPRSHLHPDTQASFHDTDVQNFNKELHSLFDEFLERYDAFVTDQDKCFFTVKECEKNIWVITRKETQVINQSNPVISSEEVKHLAPDPDIEEFGPEEWRDVVYTVKNKLYTKRNMKISNYGRFKTFHNPKPHYMPVKRGKTPEVHVNKHHFTVIKLVVYAFGELKDLKQRFRCEYIDTTNKFNTHIDNIKYSGIVSAVEDRPDRPENDIYNVKTDEEIADMLQDERWMEGPITIEPELDGDKFSRRELESKTYYFPDNMAISSAGRVKFSPQSKGQFVNRVDHHGCPIISLGGKTIRVGKIVAHVFVPKPNPYCHRVTIIDKDDPLNCSAANMKWQVPLGSEAILSITSDLTLLDRKELLEEWEKLDTHKRNKHINPFMRYEVDATINKIKKELEYRDMLKRESQEVEQFEQESNPVDKQPVLNAPEPVSNEGWTLTIDDKEEDEDSLNSILDENEDSV